MLRARYVAPRLSGSQQQGLTQKRCVHGIYEGSALGEPEAMKRGRGGAGRARGARSQQSPSLAPSCGDSGV